MSYFALILRHIGVFWVCSVSKGDTFVGFGLEIWPIKNVCITGGCDGLCGSVEFGVWSLEFGMWDDEMVGYHIHT